MSPELLRDDLDSGALLLERLGPAMYRAIHRVVSGLYSRSIGYQPFGDLLLAEADRITR